MDVCFIPETVRRLVGEDGSECGEPVCAVRLGGTFGGGTGEGFLLLYSTQLVAVDRQFGDEFRLRSCVPGELQVVRFEDGGNRIDFTLVIAGETLTGYASFSEAEALRTLMNQWRGMESRMVPVSPAAELFAAGLIFAAASDGAMSPEQERLIHTLCPLPAVRAGEGYVQNHSFEEFAAAARELFDHDRMTSLLANQLEVLMADGDLCRVEMSFLKREAALLAYPEAEYRQLRNFLILKNQATIFFE